MRFDSIAALLRFLGVLNDQGYSVPFYDYDKLLKEKGFDRHIHNYKVEIETLSLNAINIIFYGDGFSWTLSVERTR